MGRQCLFPWDSVSTKASDKLYFAQIEKYEQRLFCKCDDDCESRDYLKILV